MNDDTQALLSQLRDIQTPQVSAWPAPGWWLLSGAIALVLIIAFIWRGNRRRAGWLRQARAELLAIEQAMGEVPATQSLAALSQLTRRVVLARSPRTKVASVQGEAWLELLDKLCGEPVFTQGYGKLLASGPYQQSSACGEEELAGLTDAVERLIDAAARQPALSTAAQASARVGTDANLKRRRVRP